MIEPATSVAAIAAVSSAMDRVAQLSARNRGTKRALLLELKGNLGLMRLWLQSEADPLEIIPRIEEAAYREAVRSGFKLNSLKRSSIRASSTMEQPHLAAFVGSSTEAVFDNIYERIQEMKHAAALKTGKRNFRFGHRLHNTRRKMLMLVNHLGR